MHIRVNTLTQGPVIYGDCPESVEINSLAEARAFIIGVAFLEPISDAEVIYNGEKYIYTDSEDGDVELVKA